MYLWRHIENDPLIMIVTSSCLEHCVRLHYYGSQCIFDFEIRKKQMFTEARAFSRVTYFFIFWRASWIFS